ncbi:MAG: sulfur transferase domain-containing protein [Woeseia sp.]
MALRRFLLRKTPIVTACLLLQAGCAGTTAVPVSFMPADELTAPATTLPKAGYLSSGQPNRAALAAIAAAGYQGVVDLRAAGEPRGYDEASAARSLGLRYETLSVAGPADVSYEKAALLNELLASFDGPVLLHCSSGNRVGALLALRAKAAGASDEEALAVGRNAGLTQLEETVRQRLIDYSSEP